MLVQAFYKFFYRVKVCGLDRLPKTGPYIIAANHLSIHDPILLSAFVNPHIRFMAKEELFRIPIIRYLICRLGAFPVSRTGSCISAIRHSIHLLENGKTVGIFPEGTRNRLDTRLSAKPGVGFIAARSHADVKIIPIAISLRPRQWFKHHYIIIGEPIHVINPDDYRSLAQYVLQTIYALKKDGYRENRVRLKRGFTPE
ncbi:lysophospholipid acyltransferase family protein [Alicyclobacillus dauci]|uniref:1-acyl-sn-glycerol-3-phosphate acyltransferase n=1 Tax=Alicyclobacillus dauci TaxID=1475485 RepID=A0ABY6Z5A2_9BACL|nr:lysophospholipid acyltransferase family protein [Alicyclobacillus dauci]WAH37506.1 1-acyl-sn-glycerol-3-phosphate acyltransferase [Alicyclobacillus dauci]